MGNDKAKNYIIGVLVCLVVAMVIGVTPVKRLINETVNLGTLDGAETCVKYSSGELLTENAVRAYCISTFEKELFGGDYATGRAGPQSTSGTVSWGGYLENKTSDHVTTWVRILVNVYDDEGQEQEIFAETPIWIEPNGEAEFEIELPDIKGEQLEGLDFCDRDVAKPKACLDWGLWGVKGLAI